MLEEWCATSDRSSPSVQAFRSPFRWGVSGSVTTGPRTRLLDWIERPGLRRQTTAELNKGEARNALVRAVCFHRLGRLRDRTIEAQQYRASGLALVTAAIAIWNTI